MKKIIAIIVGFVLWILMVRFGLVFWLNSTEWRFGFFIAGMAGIYHLIKYLILNVLSPKGILFARPKEGWYIAIMEGEQFVRGMMSLSGYHLEGDSVVKDKENKSVVRDKEKKEEKKKKVHWWKRVYFLGISKKVYKGESSWAEKKFNSVAGSSEIVKMIAGEDGIPVSIRTFIFPYPLGSNPYTDINGFDVGLITSVRARILKPRYAMFEFPNWYGGFETIIQSTMRALAGSVRGQQDLNNDIVAPDKDHPSDENDVVRLVAGNQDPGVELKVGANLTVLYETLVEFEIVRKGGKAKIKRYDDVVVSQIYGLEIEGGAFSIEDIEVEPRALEFQQKKILATQEAEVIQISAEADANAEETRGGGIAKSVNLRVVGGPLMAVAEKFGVSKEEAQKKINEKDETFSQAFDDLAEESRKAYGIDSGTHAEMTAKSNEASIYSLVSGIAGRLFNPQSGQDLNRVRQIVDNLSPEKAVNKEVDEEEEDDFSALKTVEERQAWLKKHRNKGVKKTKKKKDDEEEEEKEEE